MDARFVWSATKAASNVAKHGVSFEEALAVFNDRLAQLFSDEWHSDDEYREIAVGRSIIGRLLVVSFTERPDGSIRIISARRANKQERADYEERENR